MRKAKRCKKVEHLPLASQAMFQTEPLLRDSSCPCTFVVSRGTPQIETDCPDSGPGSGGGGKGSRRVCQLQYAAQVKIFQAFGTSDFGIGAQGPTKELPRM